MPEGPEFSQRMYVRAAKFEENVDLLMRTVALSVDQAVVMATPVDTGRARANWIVSIDAPAAGTTDEVGAAAALAQGAKVIAQYGDGMRTIHITNNLPYIKRLNEGWSAQAPAGFVEEAVAAGVKAVRGAQLLPTEGSR